MWTVFFAIAVIGLLITILGVVLKILHDVNTFAAIDDSNFALTLDRFGDLEDLLEGDDETEDDEETVAARITEWNTLRG